ncbi:MAG: L,D-transpeptidase [Devosiaceae bacterium]|nr:L,D-transpeptidase [Devosiaceae bacterium]
MLKRRRFVQTSLAAGALGLSSTTMSFAAQTTAEKDAAIPDYDLPQSLMPRIVEIKEEIKPWEIYVDPNLFYLYWTMPDNRALRYATGVGRDNLYHSGEFHVAAKKEWPRWTPTQAMIKREPELYLPFKDGMEGGLDNPLGARALYLYTSNNRDSLLRLHGTNNPRTIGGAVSNGCSRLINDQIIDLYDRVPIGTRVVLMPKDGVTEVPHD